MTDFAGNLHEHAGRYGTPGWFAIQREVREGIRRQALRGALRTIMPAVASLAGAFASLGLGAAGTATAVDAFTDSTNHQEAA